MTTGKTVVVLSRDGKLKGKLTGGERVCQMESCGGIRYGVRWEDGTLTFPCSAGLRWVSNTKLRII